MDLQLFSNIVKDLLSKQDRVIINNFGIFSAEDVPAYFSDRGFTINPPYRKVSFTLCDEEDDTLARIYAQSNGISVMHARVVVNDFIDALRIMVIRNKMVDLPDFGRLRVFGANRIFFIQSKDLAIFPQFDYLEPVSLRSMGTLPVATEEPAPVERMMSTLSSQASEDMTQSEDIDQVTPETQVGEECVAQDADDMTDALDSEELAPQEPSPVSEEAIILGPSPVSEEAIILGPSPVSEEAIILGPSPVSEEQEVVKKKARHKVNPFIVVLLVLLAVDLFFALLAFLGRHYPAIVDPLLYSKEELEILNYKFR